MAFGRGNRFQCGGRKERGRLNKYKLEEGKKKGLSLDPHRNQSHHHQNYLFQQHHQDYHVEAEEGEEEEEEEEEEGKEPQNHLYAFYGLPHNFHPQQQLFYGMGEQGSSSLDLDAHQQTPQKRSHFPPSGNKMGEIQHRTSSRLGLLKTGVGGGEIVEVQGGHIVRSTGRKDRHSKVCTAKGPRDRRVRLSANTAIQFYDVQDRLGYDRPSKAVDWLIKKAKSAIDQLAELPPWHPTATNISRVAQSLEQGREEENQNQNQTGGGSSKRPMEMEEDASEYGFQQQHMKNNSSSSSGFLPPSLNSDSIADTIKSFFPVAATSSSPIHFHKYSPDPLSRTSIHTQDLCLSLQSFQDPILLQHQSHHHSNPTPSAQQALFLGSSPPHFDVASSSWSDQQHAEMGRFQRMIAWNTGTDTGGGDGEGGFVFSSPPPPQSFLNHTPFVSQRGPLQSSNSPQFRAWTQPSIAIANHNQMQPLNPSSMSGIGFASGEFSGFRVPARIQGEEEHDPASNKLPSVSRH